MFVHIHVYPVPYFEDTEARRYGVDVLDKGMMIGTEYGDNGYLLSPEEAESIGWKIALEDMKVSKWRVRVHKYRTYDSFMMWRTVLHPVMFG